MVDQYGNPVQQQLPILGDDQHARLIEMLRNSPTLPQSQSAPSASDMLSKAQDINKGISNLEKAGNGSAWNGLKSKLGLWSAPDNKYGVVKPDFSGLNGNSGMFGNIGNTVTGWFK